MDLLEELEHRVVAADGAMGTELFAAGISRETCLEELCVSDPARVEAVHRSYLAVGAQLIRTNSFGANGARLARHGLEHRVSELNWTAAQLAREVARDSRAIVAGSVGPLGEPRHDRRELYLEQIGALLDGGVRTIVLETFTDLAEIEAALEAKHTLHHCPVVACLSPRDGDHLPDGTRVSAALLRLRDAGADVVGLNCDGTLSAIVGALDDLPIDLPVAFFPSAGLPREVEGRLVYRRAPSWFEGMGVEARERGVRLLGGCCGAGPAHIAELVRGLRGSGAIF